MAFESQDKNDALQNQAAGLVTAYLAQVPQDEPRPLAVETRMETPLVDPLTGEDLDIPLLGIVDLVAGGEDGGIIADFKTASRSAPPTMPVSVLTMSQVVYFPRPVLPA